MNYTATMTSKGQFAILKAVEVPQLKHRDTVELKILDGDHFEGQLVKRPRLIPKAVKLT